MKKQIIALILFVLICLAVGALSSLSTASSVGGWYQLLTKPHFTPPDWVFGPVWTALYIIMGIAAFLVWRIKLAEQLRRQALGAFVVQLVLNALWAPIFFGLHSILGGLIVIAFLLIAILVTTILFFGLSRAAGYLMLPYLSWVSYATMINVYLMILN